MACIVHSGGSANPEYQLVKDVKGTYNASTTTLYTMTKKGFVIGAYNGHNASNTITIYKNSTQIAFDDSSGRYTSNSKTLNLQLNAGDAIKVKGNSNKWCDLHLFFYEEV